MRRLTLLPLVVLGLSLRAHGIAMMDTAHDWPPSPEGVRQWAQNEGWSNLAKLSDAQILLLQKEATGQRMTEEEQYELWVASSAYDMDMGNYVHQRATRTLEEQLRIDAKNKALWETWTTENPEEGAKVKGMTLKERESAMVAAMTPEEYMLMAQQNLERASQAGDKPNADAVKRAQEAAQRQMQRMQVGNYGAWWDLNRDEVILRLPDREEEEDRYEPKAVPPDAMADLLKLVGYDGDFSSLVKELAIRRFKRIPKSDLYLIGVLNTPKAHAAERAWAAYALGELKVRKAIPDLIKALMEKDVDLRGFAALSLGKMGDPGATAAILPLATSRSENEDLRCLALLSLASTDLPAARDVLAQAAQNRKDPSLSVRRAALMALGVKPSKAERELLRSHAGDRDPYIRSAALMGLGLTGKEEETLRARLAQDRDPTARSYAVLALGIGHSPAALEDLVTCLERDKDWIAKACAALALGRLQTPKAVSPLTRALNDRNAYFVSNYAALGLGLSRQKEALDPLTQGLEGKRQDLINSCSMALALLEDPGSLKPLLKAQDKRQYPDTRQYATLALARLHLPETYERFVEDLDEKKRGSGDAVAAAMALAIYGNPKACGDLEKRLKPGGSQGAASDSARDKVADEFTRNTEALALDLLTDDPSKPLTLGGMFKGDPRNRLTRRVGPLEVQRLLNSYLPADYKLPITP